MGSIWAGGFRIEIGVKGVSSLRFWKLNLSSRGRCSLPGGEDGLGGVMARGDIGDERRSIGGEDRTE